MLREFGLKRERVKLRVSGEKKVMMVGREGIAFQVGNHGSCDFFWCILNCFSKVTGPQDVLKMRVGKEAMRMMFNVLTVSLAV